MKREFTIEILEDGKLTVTTGDMSGEHHVSCDTFMKMLAEMMGGQVESKSLKGHVHHHSHGEAHEHHHHDH